MHDVRRHQKICEDYKWQKRRKNDLKPKKETLTGTVKRLCRFKKHEKEEKDKN